MDATQSMQCGKTSQEHFPRIGEWIFEKCLKKSQKPVFQYLDQVDGHAQEWLEARDVKLSGEHLMPSIGVYPREEKESSLSAILQVGGGTEEILFKPEVLSGYSEESREKREDTPENHSGCSTRSVMMRERGGKAGGGKGPLLSEDKALTLGTHNDQTLILDISHRQEGVRIRKDTSPTLTARAGTGGNNVPVVSIGNGQADNTRLSHVAGDLNCMHDQQAIMINQCILRRLTPLECERLQGLPDNWTLIEDSKVCSDTARYKAIGNGMAQPCADFVLSRIYQYDMREDDYKNES